MSEKRRDNRNRILREGEYQRTDGRYRFRYIDEDGKEKNVYSWRLDRNDPTPKGKKRELSLREKEKQNEAICRNTLKNEDFGLDQKSCKIKRLRRNTEPIRSFRYMIKILFICHGNICRSPMAEFVLKT